MTQPILTVQPSLGCVPFRQLFTLDYYITATFEMFISHMLFSSSSSSSLSSCHCLGLVRGSLSFYPCSACISSSCTVMIVGELTVPVVFHVFDVSCPLIFIILKFYLHLTHVLCRHFLRDPHMLIPFTN
jgi:hypothetical protein